MASEDQQQAMSRIISGKGPTYITITVDSVSSQHICTMAIPEVNITGNNVVNIHVYYMNKQMNPIESS